MKQLSIKINGKFILLCLMSMLLLIGCTAQAANPDSERKEGPLKAEIIAPPYQSAVENQVESVKKKGGIKTVTLKDNLYVIFSLGQRPSAGYKINIEKVEKQSNQIVIYYSEQKPTGMALTVLTYPTVVLKMPKSDLPITLKAIN
ncbi:protease complex subunit PrcB family protein [Ammoniphilus resinae]|uniref:PrcB C-terminal domain-containing protein n=1 Tax=Ammoniphilus resinae TaxID=861532 RepID=A0ABS4GRE8_9BACL|nr:protease complex subunit PrcB family protein [Ammoniphilus resinae]MBP1932836.1 hypothetical protein [Ammoniphilus resinae]